MEEQGTNCDLIPKELIDQYTQDLRLQLNDMACLIPLAAVGSTKALQEIVAQAHKLRGTAGIYGFPTIGVAMADIEDILTTSMPLHEQAWDRVDNALSMAKAAVGQPT